MRPVHEPTAARQLIVQEGRETILVRQAHWRTGTAMPARELRAWLRRARSRDLALLSMLNDHRYLTTDQIREVFFPGRTLRAAQIHLRQLATDLCLVMRWSRLAPVVGGPTSTPYFRGWVRLFSRDVMRPSRRRAGRSGQGGRAAVRVTSGSASSG